jgi:hypothetical protein
VQPARKHAVMSLFIYLNKPNDQSQKASNVATKKYKICQRLVITHHS